MSALRVAKSTRAIRRAPFSIKVFDVKYPRVLFEALEPRDYLSVSMDHAGVLSVWAATPGESVSVTQKQMLAGDVNGDGAVNSDDFLALDVDFLQHKQNPSWLNGDLNGDGVVNSADFAILNAAASSAAPAYIPGFLITENSMPYFFTAVAQINVITLDAPGPVTVTGNSINTLYWVKITDSVSISAPEIAAGALHTVASFYQPFTTDPTSPDYVPVTLASAVLRNPTDTGTVVRYDSASLFGTGPAMSDVAQGQVGDCYWLSALQSVANDNPVLLKQRIVDLGDGTYLIDQFHSGAEVYQRINADFSSYYSSHLTGSLWPLLFEKAYAYSRSGANTYASMNNGNMSETLYFLGISNGFFNNRLNFSTLIQDVADKRSVSVGTLSNLDNLVPLVASHAYSIIAAYTTPDGVNMVTLRNPWGFDYSSPIPGDSNFNDGIFSIKWDDLTPRMVWGVMAMTIGSTPQPRTLLSSTLFSPAFTPSAPALPAILLPKAILHPATLKPHQISVERATLLALSEPRRSDRLHFYAVATQ